MAAAATGTAAALQQYQACLGIMLRLQVEDLTQLKLDFERVGRGLTLHEFVAVMLDRVAWDEASVVPFIEDLVELFAQVDVNGDGTMEWEEFTSAIIEGGMGTISDEADWRDMQYEEHPDFADVINRPPRRVQYLPEFRRVLVHDNARPVIEIIDPSTLFNNDADDAAADKTTAQAAVGAGVDTAGSFGDGGSSGGPAFVPTLTIANKFHPLCYIAGYRRDQDNVRSERSPVQALKYLSGVDLLAVSGGDLKLTFWLSTILTAASASALETPTPVAIVHTPRPQRVLEWNPHRQHLYSISADMIISVWQVIRERAHDSKGRCEVSLFTTLKQHTDLLQDLLLLNSETLVSCGMDSLIYLWDPQTLRVRASRQGHRRGVRFVVKLSNQMFLSSGFECDVLGWDISPVATTPVFKLWGHNAPVCCIQLIPSAVFLSQAEKRSAFSIDVNRSTNGDASDGVSINNPLAGLLADQAMTVDEDGWIKWWNLSNIASAENNDVDQGNSRCLQTFRLGSDKYPWKAHSLAILNNGQTVLAAGVHKLKLLQRTRLKPRVLPSSVVLYNSVSFTLLTTSDREIRIWDAVSGTLLRTYRNIVSADISCVDLDARQRKIVVGTQRGELVVLNYLNGAILKSWTPHHLNVSAMIYCKEDQCVLTASWDRSLRLYDDNAATNALLRCVAEAHDTDIKCIAYCYAMSLVATGSADGAIKIWDYIFFLLEDTCPLEDYGLPRSAVTALVFADPYPLLLSGHENGALCCWSLSPSQPSVLLFHYFPHLRSPLVSTPSQTDDEHKGGISCCQVFFDESGGDIIAEDIHKGRYLVVTASFDGELCIDDLSNVIATANLKAFRQENLPFNHSGSYNPRRRFIRHGKNSKRLKSSASKRDKTSSHQGSHAPVENAHTAQHHGDMHLHGLSQDPQLNTPAIDAVNLGQDAVENVFKWKAHNASVRHLQIVEEPLSILSCSNDRTVQVWSLTGDCLGVLMGTEVISKTVDNASSWVWPVDTTSASIRKREQAEAVWNSMKHERLDKRALRRRKSTNAGIVRGLVSSASVPTFSSDTNAVSKLHDHQQRHSQSEPQLPDSQAARLFGQLKGETTWRQSELQVARQQAWERERAKFQERMQRIMRKKGRWGNQDAPEDSKRGGGVEQEESLKDIDSDPLDPSASLLPDTISSAIHQLPFEDKDNWSVGSLNREKQMYSNLHYENVRRAQKVLMSSGSKLRRVESMKNVDLTPSAFLLEKLGDSCVIRQNVVPVELGPVRGTKKLDKKQRSLRQTRSAASLETTTSEGRLSASSSSSSLSLNQANVADKAETSQGAFCVTEKVPPLLAPQPSVKELFLQYGEVLQQQEAEEDKIHRASLLLSRSGTRQKSSLLTIEEADAEAKDKKLRKPQSATPLRPKKSASERASLSANAAKSRRQLSLVASEKKHRILSDAALMRQEYFGPYSRDDVVNLYRTFQKIDKDQSGTITLRELVDGAGLFGSAHLRDNIMSIFSSVDKDQSGHIDLEELGSAVFNEATPEVLEDVQRMCKLLATAEKAKREKKRQLTKAQLDEVKQLFSVSAGSCSWRLGGYHVLNDSRCAAL
ncbi:hypothetical protein PINS_up021445 [Pythium insidiosum]|nr:hypothetical protein PINS_up021445 [Pythium insidiosum]